MKRWITASLIIFASHFNLAQAQQTLDQIRFLGLDLFKVDQTQVRQHLRDVGGFRQERATFSHPNVDKFFPVSNLRDSYYIEFRYDANGQIVSAKRLYRRSGRHSINEFRDLTTQDLAKKLASELGQPPLMSRKQREGNASYPTYSWQTDEITIKIDHQGSNPLQPIFVEYTLARDPFVAKIPPPENLAQNRR
jgi:hypothetical protein